MKIDYKLTEDDLLTHQLLATTQSSRLRKRRFRGKIFLWLMYLGFGLFIWHQSGFGPAVMFFLICIPLYFLYARLEKRLYTKRFRMFVKEHYQDQLDRTASITFSEKNLTMTDGVDEGIIPIADIESIHEIGTIFSIALKNNQSILLPKSNAENTGAIRIQLQKIASSRQIPYLTELDWSWK